jgi:hypothetical protein
MRINLSLATATALVLAASLGGCAALHSVSSEVSSFGEWPLARKPGTYAFERLPSQQARASETEALETAAKGALKKAGFEAVATGQEPDVVVQVGSRVGRNEGPWVDSLWWRGGFGYYRYGPWVSPRWGIGLQFDPSRYEREVAVLLRDRASGKPLFEARASTEGSGAYVGPTALGAMFEAALMDFPKLGVNPRRVVVQLPP